MKQALFPPIQLLEGRFQRRNGHVVSPADYQTFLGSINQEYRVENTTLDLYELFVGEDEAPDLSESPVATSATLPFNYTPNLPISGNRDYHCVVRKKNRFSLESFNVWETIITLDENGDEVLGPLSSPTNIKTEDTTEGSVRVKASYPYLTDRDPADKWEIYAKENADPVPGVDTPAYSGDMVIFSGQNLLNEKISGYTPGSQLHIIISVLRNEDDFRQSSEVVVHDLLVAPEMDGMGMQVF